MSGTGRLIGAATASSVAIGAIGYTGYGGLVGGVVVHSAASGALTAYAYVGGDGSGLPPAPDTVPGSDSVSGAASETTAPTTPTTPAVVPYGNTLMPPPRRTGNADVDLPALWEYVTDLYQAMAVEANLIGTQKAHTETISGLATQTTASTTKLTAIKDLPALTGPISTDFDPQQLADAYNKINAIIYSAAR